MVYAKTNSFNVASMQNVTVQRDDYHNSVTLRRLSAMYSSGDSPVLFHFIKNCENATGTRTFAMVRKGAMLALGVAAWQEVPQGK